MTSWVLKVEGGTRAVDRTEVRRALAVLIAPDQSSELVGLPSGRHRVIHGADLDAAVEAAFELSDGAGVYYRINPCRPGLEKAATNADIIARRWLLIDCDPVRPAGESCTDAEKWEGIKHAGSIAEFLASEGWPDPLWVDSGNGVQILYRIDLPADALARGWLKSILAVLGDRFDTDTSKLDRAVHRANQLAKLPGTWARKGSGGDDRPHRLARLISAPEPIGVLTTDQLGAMAGMAAGGTTIHPPKGGRSSPPPSATVPSNGLAHAHVNGHAPWAVKATSHDLRGYVKSAIHRECAIVEMTPPGARNDALNVAAFNLGTLASWEEMDGAEAKLALYAAAQAAGLEEQETAKTIASGWEAGAVQGRERPGPDPRGVGRSPQAGLGGCGATAGSGANRRLIVWAREITPRKVDWLWPGRIPVGKATTFAGQTGMGKTFAVCDIAARISTGAKIPFAGGECFRQGKVLIISAEDDADDTIVPRLIDLGADLSRIAFLSPAAEAEFSLAALGLLNDSLDQMDGDVRMVAIDPPTSYLGRVDDHKNAELRGLLAPLRRWTIARQVALVMITHINKGAANVDAMARVMGSAAWVQAVRAAHMFVADPDARGKSLFLPLKVNNTKAPAGLGYEIKEVDDGKGGTKVIIDWQGEVDTTADDAFERKTPKKSVGRTVVEWYEEQFRLKREWASNELLEKGKVYGFSFNALCKSPEYLALPIDKREKFDGEGHSLGWFKIARAGWPPETPERRDPIPARTEESPLSDNGKHRPESPESPESPNASPIKAKENPLSGADRAQSETPETGSRLDTSGLSGDSGLSGLSGAVSGPETPGAGVGGLSGDSGDSGLSGLGSDAETPHREDGTPPGWEKPQGWPGTWNYTKGEGKFEP